MVRADSRLGRVALAARRPGRPLLRVNASPWWARVLVAAGARSAPVPDSMVAVFDESAVEGQAAPEPPTPSELPEPPEPVTMPDPSEPSMLLERPTPYGSRRQRALDPPDAAFALDRALGVSLDPALREIALTHRSYAQDMGGLPSNERLEFLGDAVLGMVVTDRLYRRHPDLPEGQLAKLRAGIVSSRSLAMSARNLNLGTYLHLGRAEEAGGGRDKASILADALEALIGAVHVDLGFDAAEALIHRLFGRLIEGAGDNRSSGWTEALLAAGATGPVVAGDSVRGSPAAGDADTRRRGSAGLSARELAVAQLVTEGFTNRQIADQLFMTLQTVEAHLSRIYAKLGVNRRDGVADAMSGRAPERPRSDR